MTLSIVLSAYNGGLFLREQLESIVAQTVLPDELILINDASPDNGETEMIINEYVQRYEFAKKKNNETNLGWALSFMKGAIEAKGDLIMFSDQDDIWDKRKIEKTVKCFDDPDVNAVICACLNVDEKLNTLKPYNGTGKLYKDWFSFDKHFIYPKGVGAAMAVRKSIIEQYKDLWNPEFGHDRFIQVILTLFFRLDYLDDALILHRMHGNNATGHKAFDTQVRIATIDGNLKFIEDVKKNQAYKYLSDGRKQIIEAYVRFAEQRKNMLMERSFFKWIIMPTYDLALYPTKNTWFGDLKSINKRG